MGAAGGASPAPTGLTFGFWRDVAFWKFGAFAEKELFQLFAHDSLGIRVDGIEPVFVHNHLRMLNPQLPRVFRNILENALPQLTAPRDAVEPRQLLAEFYSHDHSCTGLGRLAWGRNGIAGVIRHSHHLIRIANSQHTATPGNCLVRSLGGSGSVSVTGNLKYNQQLD